MSINSKKFFPILLFTFILNGGLNQIILRFLFLFALLLEKDVELLIQLLVLWLWDRSYDNYMITLLNTHIFIVLLHILLLIFQIFPGWMSFFDSLSPTEFRICLIISGGWFDEVWTYNNLSFDFLNGRHVPFSKLNVTS